MPWGNVTIKGQDGRQIYIDGVYDASRGPAPGPFVVDYGQHSFETLDQMQRVDNSANATVNAKNKAVAIPLVPVNPPRPTA